MKVILGREPVFRDSEVAAFIFNSNKKKKIKKHTKKQENMAYSKKENKITENVPKETGIKNNRQII